MISSGTKKTVGKRGAVDRRLDGIDHLMEEIDEIETDSKDQFKSIKHRYTIIIAGIAGLIGWFVGGPAGFLVFGLVGLIVGYYIGNRQ